VESLQVTNPLTFSIYRDLLEQWLVENSTYINSVPQDQRETMTIRAIRSVLAYTNYYQTAYYTEARETKERY
jgi:hypothetical protein